MAYKPEIKYNPALSTEDNLKAVINWLNFLLREMCVGRVPSNNNALKDGLNTAQSALADTDAMTVDQEYRLTLLELGLTE